MHVALGGNLDPSHGSGLGNRVWIESPSFQHALRLGCSDWDLSHPTEGDRGRPADAVGLEGQVGRNAHDGEVSRAPSELRERLAVSRRGLRKTHLDDQLI